MNIKTLRLGFSSCPNDTFIFDALVNGKIDTGGLRFECHIADVEELNSMAFDGLLDITKCSYHAYAYLYGRYCLLNAGSALGKGVGPLLIAKDPQRFLNNPDPVIAIPGKYTTAAFLYKSAYADKGKKIEMLFSEIEAAVSHGKVDAGVIIHESRFTYQQKGLVKIADLGSIWEQTTGRPIPLGGIIGSKSLDHMLLKQVSDLIHQSIAFAFTHPEASTDFVKCHAFEMSEDVIQQHISLYVNDYSLSLGEDGRDAVLFMLQKVHGSNFNPAHFEVV
jgi:1,4-dihydroxy-6-naphthoate synthase